jgi:ABC-type Fe3+-siderophore transport system permease subunit
MDCVLAGAEERRGRPLNAIVRHQTMNVLANVLIWGVVAGAVLGAILYFAVPSDLRFLTERACLRFGGSGVVGQIIPFALWINRPNLAPAMTALGIMFLGGLVAGLVLSGTRRRSGV